MEKKYLYIMLGGFLGSSIRELISQYSHGMYGTLIVNIIGSFILGYLMYSGVSDLSSEKNRYLIGIGFCGGLTTFSTFMIQTFQFSRSLAFENIFLNISITLLAVFSGRAFAFWRKSWMSY